MTQIPPERMEELRNKYGPGRQEQPSSLSTILDFSRYESRQLSARLNKLQTLSIFAVIALAVALLAAGVTWYLVLSVALVFYLLTIHLGKLALRKHSQMLLRKFIDKQS